MKTLTPLLFFCACMALLTTALNAQLAGELDITFNTGTGLNNTIYNTNYSVYSIALQPDGKILIGGSFTSYNGTPRNCIARLNADGSLDGTFYPGLGPNSSVYSIALQPDGKVMISGDFTSYNGTSINRIARLNADGSLDNTFNPGTGLNGLVFTSALQPDGKVLVGGFFTRLNGTTRNRIARLNTDGSLDNTFIPGSGANQAVFSIVLQSDGRMLIGGYFTSYNGSYINRIARLNADGSLDNTFGSINSTFNPSLGPNERVFSIALQPDGKVLIGGSFTSYNGTSINHIARLNTNGTLDNTFNPATGLNNTVYSVVRQPDGKVLIGGYFTSNNGIGQNRISRLDTDGSLDNTFNPGTGADDGISAIALQPDEKVLIGGLFTSYNGIGQSRIARLHGSQAAGPLTVQTLSVDSITSQSAQVLSEVLDSGSTGVWQRGVCYHTSPNPSLRSGQHEGYTLEYGNMGVFTSGIGPLNRATSYYVRAYAINATDTAYGQTLGFTSAFDPVAITMSVPEFGFTSQMQVNAWISDDGGDSITARGFCLNTTGNPTYTPSGSNYLAISSGSHTGLFSGSFTGLLAGTTYFVRAYALNSQGAFYSQEFVVSTLPTVQPPTNPCPSQPLVYDIDSNAYYTVEINNRCWLQTNLKTTRYSNGDSIQSILPSSGLWGSVQNVMALSNDSSAVNYGHYYDWHAANDGRQLCPTGWHLPSKSEWDRLTQFSGGSTLADHALKATAGWLNQYNGGDSLGFRALPSGGKITTGSHPIDNKGMIAYYWSTTDLSMTNNAFGFAIGDVAAGMNILPKSWGLSVRCTRDTASLASVFTDSISVIASNTARVHAQITSDGAAAVTNRGFCYNTAGNPSLSDSIVQLGNGTGSFSNTLSNLLPATTYYVRAFATNSVGTAYGAALNFTTRSLCDSSLFTQSTLVENYAVRIRWTNTGSSAYAIHLREMGQSTWLQFLSNDTSRVLQNRAPGQYEYYIEDLISGVYSCTQSLSVPCADDIAYSLNAFQAPELGRLGRVRVFGTQGGKRLYDIHLVDENGDSTSALNVRQRNYTDLPAGDYSLYVRDDFGCEAAAIGQFTINAMDTNFIPSLINAPNNPPNGFRPTWHSVDGVINYQLRVVNVTDGTLQLFQTGINDTMYAVTNLPTGKLYRFNVRSRYNNGAANVVSGYSNAVSRNLPVGGNKGEQGSTEEELANSLNVQVYPNPTSGMFYVQAPEGSALELLDINGKRIAFRTAKATEEVFDLRELAQGVYILQINSKGVIHRERVVKQ